MIYESGKFQINTETYSLHRGDRELRLERLEFDLLLYLIEHRDRVVTRDEMLSALWPGKFVTDSALSSRIKAIRRALGDSGAAQKAIRTVHGRGYQFVAPVSPASRAQPAVAAPARREQGAATAATPLTSFIGRVDERALLDHHLQQALEGRCQIVFVLGEGGIGKTLLVETFAANECAASGAAVLRGQCLGEHDVTEPYFPLLDALRRGARSSFAEDVIRAVSARAPTWRSSFPELLPGDRPEERDAPTRKDQMLLELTEAMTALSEIRPVVLVLEDLQWGDPSTLEWLDYLSRLSAPVRIMLLCTIRTGQIASDAARRAIELSLRGRATRLPLAPLDREAIADYLALRLGHAATPKVVADLQAYTHGQPLYMRLAVDSWLAATAGVGDLGEFLSTIPGTLMELVEFSVSALDSRSVALLECAAVAGFEFSSPLVATNSGEDEDEVEVSLLNLSRSTGYPLVVGEVEWPDGSRSTKFRFAHHFFAQVLYERQPAMIRQRRHLAIARRLQIKCGGAVHDRAGELAEHFERAGERAEAIRFYEIGAQYAAGRGASREGASLVRRALALLERQRRDQERDALELRLLIALGNALISFEGYTAPETVRTYERARALCAELDGGPHLLAVLYGLWNNALVGGRMELATEIATQFLDQARQRRDPGEVVALRAVGWQELFRGCFASARVLFEEASARELGDDAAALVASYGEYPDVAARAALAWSLWFLGDMDRALQACREALARAESLEQPLSHAYVLLIDQLLAQHQQDADAALFSAQRSIDHATAHDLPLFVAWSLGVLGWARCERGDMAEGLEMMRESRRTAEGMGARLLLAYFQALIAEQTCKAGDPAQAMEILESTLCFVEETGAHFYDAELHRIRGECLLALPRPSWRNAKDAFARAVAVARQQESAALELRALLSWAGAELRRGKPDIAFASLREHYRGRGASTADRDLARARELLGSVG